jgi:hypothetical protein
MIFFRCKSIDGAATRDLAALLRRIIFIGKAALRLRLDNQRVGLGALDSGDQRVVGVLEFSQTRYRLCSVIGDRCHDAGGEDFGRRLRARERSSGSRPSALKNSLKCGDRRTESGTLHT